MWLFKLDGGQIYRKVKNYSKFIDNMRSKVSQGNKAKSYKLSEMQFSEVNGVNIKLFRKYHSLALRQSKTIEIWQRGSSWTFHVNTTSNVTDVILDPDKKLPDTNRGNNKMKEKPF